MIIYKCDICNQEKLTKFIRYQVSNDFKVIVWDVCEVCVKVLENEKFL